MKFKGTKAQAVEELADVLKDNSELRVIAAMMKKQTEEALDAAEMWQEYYIIACALLDLHAPLKDDQAWSEFIIEHRADTFS